jgi:hypothetical protein
MNGQNASDPTRSGWERRSAAGEGRVDDEAAVGDRVGSNGLLQQAVEEQAATPRAASVEAEGELVEVGIEVLWLDAALVGTQQSALEQAREPLSSARVTEKSNRRASDGRTRFDDVDRSS